MKIVALLLLLAISQAFGENPMTLTIRSIRSEVSHLRESTRQSEHNLAAMIKRAGKSPTPQQAKARIDLESQVADLTIALFQMSEKLERLESHLNLQRPCPICGGKLVAVGTVKDDLSKPSKNLLRWNRTEHANCLWPGYFVESPFCTKCGFLRMADRGGPWERTSNDADSFVQPLAPAIRTFPIPAAVSGKVVFEQSFLDGKHEDELRFSFQSDGAYEERAKTFARDNGLLIDLEQLSTGYLRVSIKP